jgi:hypothetical protein
LIEQKTSKKNDGPLFSSMEASILLWCSKHRRCRNRPQVPSSDLVERRAPSVRRARRRALVAAAAGGGGGGAARGRGERVAERGVEIAHEQWQQRREQRALGGA